MRLLTSIRDTALNILGDIKIFKYPPVFVYDPKSYKFKGHHYKQVLDVVQEGDVLLRRFDGYLNSYFIPGYWNHAGVYLGGESNKVLHAVAEGVIMETLFDFCKTDHVIVLRPQFDIDFIELSNKIQSTLSKKTKYDFSFNFEENTDLSCTELIWFLYKDLDSKLVLDETKFLKMKILPPDSIIKANFKTVLEIRN